MKTSLIIKSSQASMTERITFDTVLDFNEKELINIIKACTPYMVLPDNKNIETSAETTIISLESAIKYVQDLKFYYDKLIPQKEEVSTLVLLLNSLPFNIINKVYHGKNYTFFRFNKALKYDINTSYAIIKSLFFGYNIYISSLGDPYIKRKIVVTREDDKYGIYDVHEKYYSTYIQTEAEY